jgi:hypothetical protein
MVIKRPYLLKDKQLEVLKQDFGLILEVASSLKIEKIIKTLEDFAMSGPKCM